MITKKDLQKAICDLKTGRDEYFLLHELAEKDSQEMLDIGLVAEGYLNDVLKFLVRLNDKFKLLGYDKRYDVTEWLSDGTEYLETFSTLTAAKRYAKRVIRNPDISCVDIRDGHGIFSDEILFKIRQKEEKINEIS